MLGAHVGTRNTTWLSHLVTLFHYFIDFYHCNTIAGFLLVRAHHHQPWHTAHIKTHRKRVLQLIASAGKKERSESDKYWRISTHGRFVFFMPVFDHRRQVRNGHTTSPITETTCEFLCHTAVYVYGEAVCTRISTTRPLVGTLTVGFHTCSLTVTKRPIIRTDRYTDKRARPMNLYMSNDHPCMWIVWTYERWWTHNASWWCMFLSFISAIVANFWLKTCAMVTWSKFVGDMNMVHIHAHGVCEARTTTPDMNGSILVTMHHAPIPCFYRSWLSNFTSMEISVGPPG